jgi:hypothetical protein
MKVGASTDFFRCQLFGIFGVSVAVSLPGLFRTGIYLFCSCPWKSGRELTQQDGLGTARGTCPTLSQFPHVHLQESIMNLFLLLST